MQLVISVLLLIYEKYTTQFLIKSYKLIIIGVQEQEGSIEILFQNAPVAILVLIIY